MSAKKIRRSLRTAREERLLRKFNDFPWMTSGATTPRQLEKHRAAIEKDCFRGVAHQRLLREAAAEYDAALLRDAPAPGRRKAIHIPKSNWQDAA